MPYIIIDTEGTGLFRAKETMPDGRIRTVRSDEPGQPRMAEYAHVLVDDDFNFETSFQQYIKPEGWENADGSPMLEMPKEAFEKHGLSMEFLYEHGQPILLALETFLHDAEGRVFLGYNQQHDGRQVRGELRRAGLPDRFKQTPSICAMRSLQDAKIKIPKLNGKGGYPRLIDAAAYFKVRGYEYERPHSALADAIACWMISKKLHEAGQLLPAAIHYSKNDMEAL